MAYWNLGWMYQSGKGVARDWHLAKRYYDLSRETGEEAGLAVWFSLWGLYLQRYANTSFFTMLPYFSFSSAQRIMLIQIVRS